MFFRVVFLFKYISFKYKKSNANYIIILLGKHFLLKYNSNLNFDNLEEKLIKIQPDELLSLFNDFTLIIEKKGTFFFRRKMLTCC